MPDSTASRGDDARSQAAVAREKKKGKMAPRTVLESESESASRYVSIAQLPIPLSRSSDVVHKTHCQKFLKRETPPFTYSRGCPTPQNHLIQNACLVCSSIEETVLLARWAKLRVTLIQVQATLGSSP